MAIWFCASDKYALVTAWAASTALAAGSIRRQVSPAAGSERCFRTAAGGTTGTTEPVWVLTKGSTSPTDGTITDWTEITGSSTYNTTASWLAPHASLNAAAPWMAAGDTLYVGNHHAASRAATLTTVFPGTLALPNLVLSVDDTNATPTLLAGAADNTTTGSFAQSINGSAYFYGLQLLNGGTSAYFLNGQSGRQIFDRCDIGFNVSSGSSWQMGVSAGVRQFFLNNCNFRLPGTTLRFAPYSHLRINGGTFQAGTSATQFLALGQGGGSFDVVVDGLDFSNMPAAVQLCSGNSASGLVRFQNCKPPASWTGSLVGAAVTAATRYEMFATALDDTVFQEQVQDHTGSVIQETATFTRTGGAAIPNSKAGGVDPQPFAWKFAPSATYCSYPSGVLKSSPIAIDSLIAGTSAIGGAVTLTAHVLVDSAAEPNDNDIFMEVSSINGAGFTLDSMVTTAPTTVLTAPQSLTSKFGGAGSGWTTTGMTNPKMRKLVATFTPQEKGFLLATINVANSAFTAVYVDPNIVVS